VAPKADGIVTEMPASMLSGGAARWLAHLASEPQETMAVFGVGLRERHGAIVTLFVPAGARGPGEETSSQNLQTGEPMPRFATIVKDERSFIVEIDEATTMLLGWSAQEMPGHRSIEFMHPDDIIDISEEMAAHEALRARAAARQARRRDRRARGGAPEQGDGRAGRSLPGEGDPRRGPRR
jgi:PAS domain-containing protein